MDKIKEGRRLFVGWFFRTLETPQLYKTAYRTGDTSIVDKIFVVGKLHPRRIIISI